MDGSPVMVASDVRRFSSGKSVPLPVRVMSSGRYVFAGSVSTDPSGKSIVQLSGISKSTVDVTSPYTLPFPFSKMRPFQWDCSA